MDLDVSGSDRTGGRPETLRDYRVRLGLDDDGQPTGKGAVDFFGRIRLSAIEPRHVREFITKAASRGIAQNTVRLELAPVKALFATALEDGSIRSNPCAGVRIAVASNDENDDGLVKAPTPAEYAELVKNIDKDWRLLIEFMGETGLRIGETVALRFDDVDMGACRVNVRRRWYRGSFGPPKSKYGRRSVPVTEQMAKRLWASRSKRKAKGEDFVFVSERGKMIDQSNVASRFLKPAAASAGAPWLSFHSLRHYCATELFRRGLNAKQVQLWLGHHSPAFTLERYVHLLPDDLPASPFGPPAVEAEQPEEGNTRATRPTETHLNKQVASAAG